MRPRHLPSARNEWTRLLRVSLGSGQVKVMAIDLGVSSSAVSQLLRGGRPSTETLARAEASRQIRASAWIEKPAVEDVPGRDEAALTKNASTPDDRDSRVAMAADETRNAARSRASA